jgi:hypothetical protein
VSIALVAGAASIVMSSTASVTISIPASTGADSGGDASLSRAPPYAQPEQRFAFVDAATTRCDRLPGVASVTATSHLPLIDRDVPVHEVRARRAAPRTAIVPVPSFVDAATSRRWGSPSAEVTPSAAAEARRAAGPRPSSSTTRWPGATGRIRDPIGREVALDRGTADAEGWYTIVGVAGEVSQRQLPAGPENQMYLPWRPRERYR